MIKKLKKAFTITELVIVIAVIAILAAVLIPTFSNVIQRANESASMQNCHNAFSDYTEEKTGLVASEGNANIENDDFYVFLNGGLHLIGNGKTINKVEAATYEAKEASTYVSGTTYYTRSNTNVTGAETAVYGTDKAIGYFVAAEDLTEFEAGTTYYTINKDEPSSVAVAANYTYNIVCSAYTGTIYNESTKTYTHTLTVSDLVVNNGGVATIYYSQPVEINGKYYISVFLYEPSKSDEEGAKTNFYSTAYIYSGTYFVFDSMPDVTASSFSITASRVA